MSNYELIIRLKQSQERSGYNKMWVYYRFLLEHKEDIYPEDFIKLGKVLGYKEAWAYCKQKDWVKDLKKIKEDNAEFFRLKVLNKQYVQGNDLKSFCYFK